MDSMIVEKPETKRVTLNLPKALLSSAQEQTDAGITQTVIKGLERLRAEGAYQALLKMKGTIDLELNIDSLREDRIIE